LKENGMLRLRVLSAAADSQALLLMRKELGPDF
jgi:hypothetical protein